MLRLIIIALLMLLLILQYQLWVGDGGLGQRAALQREIDLQKEKNRQLEARNQVIAEEIEVLSNGTEGLEELARSRLGMIGEDETFYLIPVDEDNSSTNADSDGLQPRIQVIPAARTPPK